MLQGLRCKVGWHKWGPPEGDHWGFFHVCTYCGKSKRFGDSQHRPDAHDR